ncbi:ABC transporter permease [Breoghania sp.]|uniref:ABC transporter permease n=1 Tax=Breoghania sp. TaxID=2065378 RepID=UPI0026274182|nr:ABC transporter permease [Breoghania sp.]
MASLNFIFRRILQMIPTIIFILVRLLPGDPATVMLGDRGREADIARINAQLDLDTPLFVQFLYFIRNVFSGNLGNSISLRVPVASLLIERLPVTLLLTAMAAVIAVIFSVPLGFWAALKQNRTTDMVIRGVFQVGLSMPVFYVGFLLLIFFGAHLHWFPIGGYGHGFLDHLYHLFPPALTLALSLSAILMRNLRAAILNVMDAEYVDFARSKRLRGYLILTRHVLRNALISTVTLFGLQVGVLLGGAVITEMVFAIPGAGRLMIDSIYGIYGRDYPVIQGLTITLTMVVSLIFLATDLLRAWLDPRITR